MASRSASAANGDGGRSRTVTSPPRTATSTRRSPSPAALPRRLPSPDAPRRAPAPPPRRRRRPGSARSRRQAAAGRASAASSSAGSAATSSTVAWPALASHRPTQRRPRPTVTRGKPGNRRGTATRTETASPSLDLGPARSDGGSARARRRLRVAPDQRRPRAGPRGHARRPQRLAGERDLCRHQDRQQQERNHRDQLDRGGPLLPVACAAGGPGRHRPTVPAPARTRGAHKAHKSVTPVRRQ